MARKKGGAKLKSMRNKPKVPPLLKRPPPPPSIGPKPPPGHKAKDIIKRAGGLAYDAAEAFANPAAPGWNRLVGPESKWNTKNMTKRLLPGPLKKLVPTPRGKSPAPERKPQKAKAPKTWRDRMNGRKNLN
jgi:hypothetical protein